MIASKIYVGLNDSETMTQIHETDKYISILKKVCFNYKVPFSFSLENGGYIHEDGTYTHENSLVLTLIGADSEVVTEIAKDLCAFFNQETVLIMESKVRAYMISESV